MALSICFKRKKVIAVSGTHGKTTVTSMIAHAFKEDGKNNFGHLIAGVPEEIILGPWAMMITS